MSRHTASVASFVLGLALATAPGALRAGEGEPGSPLLPFDGDLCADLAIGIPYGGVGTIQQAGSLAVLYGGSPAGLSANGSDLWTQTALVSDGPETGDRFGGAAAVGDFNGDGFADLAAGAHSEGFGGLTDAGVVHVVYGTATGLTATGNQLWSQDSDGIAGDAESNESFGQALTTADFNHDGFADLAVGVPQEDYSATDDGMVYVLYGSATGLTAAGNQAFARLFGLSQDVYGWTLAGGDFNGDGFADLAIGAPYAEGTTDEGLVEVYYGSAAGLATAGQQTWDQGDLGVTPAAGDEFGWAMAAGDFDGDRFADLAISADGRAVGSAAHAGVVYELRGSPAGLTATGSATWSQNTPGVGGASEPEDWFGSALAAGDLDGDRYADLAIGEPYEDLTVANAGCVNVLYGSAAGLVAGAEVWHQDIDGILDQAEASDFFGRPLAIGDFDGDGYGDLAVGAPGEILESAGSSSGATHVLYGSQDGLGATGNQLWHQEVDGVPGTGGGSFGYALSSVPVSRAFLFADDLEGGGTAAWSATSP